MAAPQEAGVWHSTGDHAAGGSRIIKASLLVGAGMLQ